MSKSQAVGVVLLMAFGIAAFSFSGGMIAAATSRSNYVTDTVGGHDSIPSARQLNSKCDAGTDVRSSDLCAQWKAADAAQNAAKWAMWGTLVAAVGSTLLIWNLFQAREAVAVARDDLDQNKSGLRAWVVGDALLKFVILNSTPAVEVSVKWKNTGQTPARNAHSSFGPDSLPDSQFLNFPPDEMGSIIGPGEDCSSSPAIVFIKPLFDTKIPAKFKARIQYMDIFSNEIRVTDKIFSIHYLSNTDPMTIDVNDDQALREISFSTRIKIERHAGI